MILAFMRAVLLGKSRVGSRSRSGISGVILHNPIRDLLESKPYNDRSNFPRFQCLAVSVVSFAAVTSRWDVT